MLHTWWIGTKIESDWECNIFGVIDKNEEVSTQVLTDTLMHDTDVILMQILHWYYICKLTCVYWVQVYFKPIK